MYGTSSVTRSRGGVISSNTSSFQNCPSRIVASFLSLMIERSSYMWVYSGSTLADKMLKIDKAVNASSNVYPLEFFKVKTTGANLDNKLILLLFSFNKKSSCFLNITICTKYNLIPKGTLFNCNLFRNITCFNNV